MEREAKRAVLNARRKLARTRRAGREDSQMKRLGDLTRLLADRREAVEALSELQKQG